MNKRLCKVSGEWSDNDVGNASKSNIKKRKLSGVLDFQWSKEELRQFYDAFRKHGKNWKKVAGLIRNRSLDMVEGLYNLNRRYLSLAEGIATADGFLAMMTDHYNNLEGQDNGYEEKCASVKTMTPRCFNGKCGPDISRGSGGRNLQGQSVKSSSRRISRKSAEALSNNCWPRAVGKRTPRILVCHYQEASQGSGSLPISKPPVRRAFPHKIKEKENYSAQMEVDTANFGGDTRMLSIDDVNQNGCQHKKQQLQEMRPNIPGANCQFSDVGEAFGGSSKGFEAWKFQHKINGKVSDFSQGLRDKNRLRFLEGCSGDALELLADVTLNIELQASSTESEPALSGEKREDKNDSCHHPSKPGALSLNPETDDSKVLDEGDSGHFFVLTSCSPCSLTVLPESVDSRVSSLGDKEYSSTVAGKSNLPELLSVNSERDTSKIIVQGNEHYSSAVRCGGGAPLKVDKLTEDVANEDGNMEKVLSETEQGQCPYISMMQNSFAENRQISEVEGHNDSCVDAYEKIKDINSMPLNPAEKDPQYPRNQNGIGAFCRLSSGKTLDGCLTKGQHEHDCRETVVPYQNIAAEGILINTSSNIPCIASTKQATLCCPFQFIDVCPCL